MATTSATAKPMSAAHWAAMRTTPISTKSTSSGSAAKIEDSPSESLTGSKTWVYIGLTPLLLRSPPDGPTLPGKCGTIFVEDLLPIPILPHARVFITCVNDTLFPQTGRAAVEALERLGQEVVLPDKRARTRCPRRRPDRALLAGKAVSTVKKSHATTLAAGERRNSRQLGPERLGAGPRPARASSRRTVLGETDRPSLSSSPAIRWYPQRGFSRASRSTSSRVVASIGGRPGVARGYVQRLRTSSRCQRSSVCGATSRPWRRAGGSRRPAAASKARSLGRSFGRSP